jgi:hypothetical protein
LAKNAIFRFVPGIRHWNWHDYTLPRYEPRKFFLNIQKNISPAGQRTPTYYAIVLKIGRSFSKKYRLIVSIHRFLLNQGFDHYIQVFVVIHRRNDTYRGNFIRGINCAHSRTLKMLPWSWFREGLCLTNQKWTKFRIFAEKPTFQGFSWQGIDCAHYQSMKMLAWPWSLAPRGLGAGRLGAGHLSA